ncbi:uncharacterized protein A4U43_C02F13490 [Asparagus officinalis]|uniref:Uncharacterized protein n=1 Tax=Asparagus officinalis TaxID=4686 RepID=A0A5P1FJY7_ASPOF|nr:uncharacterized protein A4U43_C02F13490 [Asparagus officinalis]
MLREIVDLLYRDRVLGVLLVLEAPCHATNREDRKKIVFLKHECDFHQEGLFGINIIGLRPGFVNEDAPVNEVVVVPNTFGNELVKNNAQYSEGDAKKVCHMRIRKRQVNTLHLKDRRHLIEAGINIQEPTKPVPKGSSRIREESPIVPVQGPRIGSSGKESIPLDNKEEQVDYGHDDTDAYLTELDDVGDISDIDDEHDFRIVGEAMPTSFLVSGHFEPVIDFKGAYGVLVSVPAI